MSEVGRTPFNLMDESSARVEILVTPSGLILLNFWVHHMNHDIMSQGVFMRELHMLLNATPEAPARLTELSVQYVDYAFWTRECAKKGLYDAGPLLEDLGPLVSERLVLDLPTDFPRPKTWTFKGDRVVSKLDFEGKVDQEGITPFIVFLTAFFVQLSKASSQETVVMGVPYHGRDQACLEPLCGYFINMVPVVSTLKPGITVVQAMHHVRERWARAAESSHIPFLYLMDQLRQQLRFQDDPQRNPIFQAMLNYRKDATKPLIDNRFMSQPVHQVEAHVDFDIQIDQVGSKGTLITHNYCTDLFGPRTAEIFAAQYMAILRCFTTKQWASVDVYRLPADIATVRDVQEAPVMSPEKQYELFAPILQHLGLSHLQPPLIVENKANTIFVSAC
jgi:hypothetical protein